MTLPKTMLILLGSLFGLLLLLLHCLWHDAKNTHLEIKNQKPKPKNKQTNKQQKL